MNKRLCNEVRYINGAKVWVGQMHIRDAFHYEGRGNPILWFIKTLDAPRDWIICGLNTKREALFEAGKIISGSKND